MQREIEKTFYNQLCREAEERGYIVLLHVKKLKDQKKNEIGKFILEIRKHGQKISKRQFREESLEEMAKAILEELQWI